jgi:2-methylisocitrate lyase-like PEP mutase family enzyme
MDKSKGAAFRLMHDRERAFIIPNPWDRGSARILAGMGFEALATTSAGMAFSLGIVEGSASREQTLDHCRTIVEATSLPVSADLEKGFADVPEAMAATIVSAAGIGLAGGSIEDHTGDPSKPIYDFALAVERIAAAAEAVRGLPQDFVLTARCENFLWGRPDLDDTIRRLQAFEAAGADVLYAPGLPDLDAIRTVCSSLQRPVNVVMGMPGALFSLAELADAGVKRVSVGSALARLAYGSLLGAAEEMRGSETFTCADQAAPFAAIERYFRDL